MCYTGDARTFARGHVQSSFEVVADRACDPTLVARIALCSRLVRADRAAVLVLDRAIATQAGVFGVEVDGLLDDLAALGGQAVPGNVATILRGWFATPAHPPADRGQPPDVGALAQAARAAVQSAE